MAQDTESTLAQQQRFMEYNQQALNEQQTRFRAEIHELRHAYELERQATDRGIAARVIELNTREAAVTKREHAATEKEAYLEGVLAQLKGILPPVGH